MTPGKSSLGLGLLQDSNLWVLSLRFNQEKLAPHNPIFLGKCCHPVAIGRKTSWGTGVPTTTIPVTVTAPPSSGLAGESLESVGNGC